MAGGLRIVVTGATGNIGTSVVTALAAEPLVESIVGVARREAAWQQEKLELVAVDLAEEVELDELVGHADVVVHLAWRFQPTHDPSTTWRTNVLGSIRMFEAVGRCGVPALVYSSSVGAYSPGPKDDAVPESWPTHGAAGASYSREKAYLERYLDYFECAHPGVRVVRLRPGFSFKHVSASEQRRLFGGRLLPGRWIGSGALPFVPDLNGLRMQAVHTSDLAEAFRLAVVEQVYGAFNVASRPVVDPRVIAELLGKRRVRVSSGLVRTVVSASWHARLLPASPDLFDLVRQLPVMDTSRARIELGWTPKYSATEAVEALLTGLREGGSLPTAPLAR